jgi:hypothetical protein
VGSELAILNESDGNVVGCAKTVETPLSRYSKEYVDNSS